mmetsp:Transcript_22625/g.73556  ORF Transcript_22625/g.73556 Transcript_22625/m.73556 type:complete len:260 (-) Transcript_22625:3105-3884(-)
MQVVHEPALRVRELAVGRREHRHSPREGRRRLLERLRLLDIAGAAFEEHTPLTAARAHRLDRRHEHLRNGVRFENLSFRELVAHAFRKSRSFIAVEHSLNRVLPRQVLKSELSGDLADVTARGDVPCEQRNLDAQRERATFRDGGERIGERTVAHEPATLELALELSVTARSARVGDDGASDGCNLCFERLQVLRRSRKADHCKLAAAGAEHSRPEQLHRNVRAENLALFEATPHAFSECALSLDRSLDLVYERNKREF